MSYVCSTCLDVAIYKHPAIYQQFVSYIGHLITETTALINPST